MIAYYESVDIFHQKIVPRTPQQNGVVERRNRTLVEAARTMLIFSKAPMFLWAEAVATACYTQNRSLIHTRHNKTSYELVHDKKPDLTFFRVFAALCYPTNNSEDLGKLQPKADIGIFVGYAPSRKGYKIYNKRTRRIIETIQVQFDERSLVSAAPAVPVPVNSAGTPSSTTIDQDSPSLSHSPSSSTLQSLSLNQGVAAGSTIIEDNPFAPVDNNPFVNMFALEPSSEASLTGMSGKLVAKGYRHRATGIDFEAPAGVVIDHLVWSMWNNKNFQGVLRLEDVLSWLLVEGKRDVITVDIHAIALFIQAIGSSPSKNDGTTIRESSWGNAACGCCEIGGVLHKLVSMVEKDELFEDTKHNLPHFDS
ncbi:retrovirus-related pol polyprotein from transposon TNT 1-94 [Tanacetum coccineum]